MDTYKFVEGLPPLHRRLGGGFCLSAAVLCIAVLATGCGSGARRTGAQATSAVTRPSGPPVRVRRAFLVKVGGGLGASEGDLYLVNAATGKSRLIASGVDLTEEPRWSPDGTRVLSTADRQGSTDVLSYPVGGGRPVDLTPTRGRWESQPRPSPDGTRVAFLSQRGDTSDNDLYVVPSAGGRGRLVVRHADGLAWSPDSRLLAFDPGLEGPPRSGLWLVSASGGRARQFAGGGAGESIEWGPGGRILYTASGATIAHPTYLSTADGEREVGVVGDPQFLPDGTVAFLQTEHKLGFLRPSGSRRSVGLPARTTSAAWSPDGRYLTFASAWTGRVYLARGNGSGARRLRQLRFTRHRGRRLAAPSIARRRLSPPRSTWRARRTDVRT